MNPLRLVAVTFVSLATAQPTQSDDSPFLGLGLRDTPDGPVVSWIFPGPLGGAGYSSLAGIARGDNVDAVYLADEPTADARRSIATAADLNDLIATLRPGQTVIIEARRSPDAQPNAAVPRGGPGGETTRYRATLGSRSQWTGTVGLGLDGRDIPLIEPGEFEQTLLDAADKVGIRTADGSVDALLAHLARVQENALDPNSLSAVVQCFRNSLSVDSVESSLARRARAAATGEPEAIAAFIRAALDLPHHALQAEHASPPERDIARLRDDGRALVRRLRDTVSIGGDDAEAQIRAIRDSRGFVAPHLTRTIALWSVISHWEAIGHANARGEPLADLPPRIREAVRGDVLFWMEFPNGAIGVVGGPGPNEYDMRVIADVYDLGGNDLYRFAPADDSPSGGNHHVIDLAGDDLYIAEGDFCGPGVGIFGLSIVDDRAGNDTYRSSGQFSIGAGLFGVGVIIDHAGDDTYENLGPASGWAIGAGVYGAGLVIDLDGHDTYHGEQLVQGVGGPRGLGAIIDARGNDSYEANGPSFPSVYGTAGVYKAFSQGFGYGARSYAVGGIGAIYDLDGDDRYEAGEFAQACAYYFALGILHDFAGNDRYQGNRYGQGSAAHQAIGILIDDAGDDEYRAMTAACQGSSWDESIGILIDRAGNDTYKADGLAQGSASMQAIGILIDLSGDDVYEAAGNARHGRSGGNNYHYDAARVFSFSALLDLGGGTDRYNADRTNDSTTATGSFNESSPADSDLHGVFVDR